MWAKNGGKCLPKVLSRINKVIPEEGVCHRILVDDHSSDQTVEIARDFNWDIYVNPRGGIPIGANEALKHVDRDFFVSIEQDVLLAYDWWDRIPEYVKNPFVACAQGIRVHMNPTLRLLDDWQFDFLKRNRLLSSMDNNIFRTKVIRFLGGFPQSCPVCADTILMKRILSETRYKWIVDPDVISLHMRFGLKNSVEHTYKMISACARTPLCADNRKPPISSVLRIFLTSPIRALQIAFANKSPNIIWNYPFLRLYQLEVGLRWRTTKISGTPILNNCS